jgi:hypothetical protein
MNRQGRFSGGCFTEPSHARHDPPARRAEALHVHGVPRMLLLVVLERRLHVLPGLGERVTSGPHGAGERCASTLHQGGGGNLLHPPPARPRDEHLEKLREARGLAEEAVSVEHPLQGRAGAVWSGRQSHSRQRGRQGAHAPRRARTCAQRRMRAGRQCIPRPRPAGRHARGAATGAQRSRGRGSASKATRLQCVPEGDVRPLRRVVHLLARARARSRPARSRAGAGPRRWGRCRCGTQPDPATSNRNVVVVSRKGGAAAGRGRPRAGRA